MGAFKDGRTRQLSLGDSVCHFFDIFDGLIQGLNRIAVTSSDRVLFEDLASGKKISVILAPAFLANYPKEYQRVLGYLKSKGVNHICSVSFGADITTWGYLKYITEHKFLGHFPAVSGSSHSFGSHSQQGNPGGKQAWLFSPQLYANRLRQAFQALSRNGSVCARNKNWFLLI